MDRYALTSDDVQPGQESASRALLVCPDAGMATELASVLALEWPSAQLYLAETYRDGAGSAELAATAQVCFIDVATDADQAAAAMARFTAGTPELPLVVLLAASDPDLILKYIRLGAAEFLIQPFTNEQVRTVLAKLARLHAGLAAVAEPGGKVFCVMPGKGASGATTLACNLAFALKRIAGGRVLLADLDGLTGTVSFVLKLKPGYSFVDALGHAGALDEEIWRALATHCHGVDVLLSPDNPVDCYTEPLDPAVLIRAARESYDLVVVDSGGAHGDWNEALARLADVLLIVTTNEAPAMHATLRALAHLKGAGVDLAKTRMIVNRVNGKPKKVKDSLAIVLGTPIFATLPGDYEGIRKALLQGQPSAVSSDFGRSVAALARALAGAQKPAAKKSFLSWLHL